MSLILIFYRWNISVPTKSDASWLCTSQTIISTFLQSWRYVNTGAFNRWPAGRLWMLPLAFSHFLAHSLSLQNKEKSVPSFFKHNSCEFWCLYKCFDLIFVFLSNLGLKNTANNCKSAVKTLLDHAMIWKSQMTFLPKWLNLPAIITKLRT